MFGKGISKTGDILDLAVKENIVEKSGAWFAYGGSKIGQGRENAKQYLAEHPAICAEIEAQVRVRYQLPGAEEAEAEARKAAQAENVRPASSQSEAKKILRQNRQRMKKHEGHSGDPVDKRKCKVFLEEEDFAFPYTEGR